MYGNTPGYAMVPKVLTSEEKAERAAAEAEAEAERVRCRRVREIVTGALGVEFEGEPTDAETLEALGWYANEDTQEERAILRDELRRRFVALRERIADLEEARVERDLDDEDRASRE